MLRAIREFFENKLTADTADTTEHRLRLATAALLIETTRADLTVHAVEREAVASAVRNLFGLPSAETDELIMLAEREVGEATDLFQFTHLIDKCFPPEDKRRIVEMLWRVSFADAHKNAHEEHLVRKISDLLHVPHSDFIQARMIAEQESAAH